MAVTASRLRAIVSAETDQAQTKMKQFGQTVTDTATTSKRDLSGLAGLVRGDLSGAFALFGGGAAAVAVAGLVKAGVAMNNQREIALNVKRELEAYAGGAQQALAGIVGRGSAWKAQSGTIGGVI
jgi:5-enolpyruvylshikimate-3-phosphate synthase